MNEDIWQLKRLDTGAVGPVVGMFIVGIWSHVKWTRPVRNGIEITWEEFNSL